MTTSQVAEWCSTSLMTKKTYVVYYQGLLLRQIEAELFFYKNLHNVKVPSTVCISKLWKKDIHNGMCIRSHIRKSLSYEDDFFFFYIYLLKLPRHCDLLRRQQFLNCLSIYCCSFSASTQFSGQDEKVKRVFNMSLHRISVTELLTHSIAFSRKLLSCGHFVNFFLWVNQSGAKKMTEEVLITYCWCTIH